MQELMYYTSPFGPLTVAADDQGIVGTWWDTDRYYGDILEANARQVSPQANAFLRHAQVWLTEYFAGKIPGELPPLHLVGTPFQREVWQVLLTIPYGQTMTYGMIAHVLEQRRKKPMSAQAVGTAVGRNHVSLFVPCHRVIGQKTGAKRFLYAAGPDKKRALLEWEATVWAKVEDEAE